MIQTEKRNNLGMKKKWPDYEDWAWRVKQHDLFKYDEKAMRAIDEIVQKMNDDEAFKEVLL